ncbi:MAG: glycosyltransferase [Candidatus Hodarchaeota archaeon]
MTPKRVVLIGSEPRRMTRLRRTFNSLKELGVSVEVFIPYDVPRGRPRTIKGIIRYLLVMLQLLLLKRDIYHFYNVPDVIGIPLLLKRGTLIYDVRSPWFSSLKEMIGIAPLSMLGGLVERFLSKSADVVLAANTPLARRAKNWGSKDTIVVPNYPPQTFGPSRTREDMRRHLNLEDAPTVLYLGKISRLEGSELLKGIISETAKTIEDVRFLIVGDGPRKKSIQDYISARNLNKHVVFIDWVPHSESANYILASDLCLLPREWTTFSPYTSPENILKVGEYLAVGRAVIAPKMGGFADATFPVIAVEPADMASAVIEYLTNPKPFATDEHLSWDVSHQRLRNLYTRLGAI